MPLIAGVQLGGPDSAFPGLPPLVAQAATSRPEAAARQAALAARAAAAPPGQHDARALRGHRRRRRARREGRAYSDDPVRSTRAVRAAGAPTCAGRRRPSSATSPARRGVAGSGAAMPGHRGKFGGPPSPTPSASSAPRRASSPSARRLPRRRRAQRPRQGDRPAHRRRLRDLARRPTRARWTCCSRPASACRARCARWPSTTSGTGRSP